METNLEKNNIPQNLAEETNSFYFYNSFNTRYSFFGIFVNKNKIRFLPVLLDYLQFVILSDIIDGKLEIKNCGIYSYLIQLVDGKKLFMDCVNLTYSESLGIPLSNLVIRNKKTQKIDDISKVFVFPAEGAIISLLLKRPILIDSFSIEYLTLPIISSVELPALINFIKASITALENKKQ